jgi:hypothetical protein
MDAEAFYDAKAELYIYSQKPSFKTIDKQYKKLYEKASAYKKPKIKKAYDYLSKRYGRTKTTAKEKPKPKPKPKPIPKPKPKPKQEKKIVLLSSSYSDTESSDISLGPERAYPPRRMGKRRQRKIKTMPLRAERAKEDIQTINKIHIEAIMRRRNVPYGIALGIFTREKVSKNPKADLAKAIARVKQLVATPYKKKDAIALANKIQVAMGEVVKIQAQMKRRQKPQNEVISMKAVQEPFLTADTLYPEYRAMSAKQYNVLERGIAWDEDEEKDYGLSYYDKDGYVSNPMYPNPPLDTDSDEDSGIDSDDLEDLFIKNDPIEDLKKNVGFQESLKKAFRAMEEEDVSDYDSDDSELVFTDSEI